MISVFVTGLIICLFVFGFIIYLYVVNMGPVKKGVALDELQYYVNTLYRSGYDLGIVIFTRDGGREFVQVMKHLLKPKGAEIIIDFPKAPWSEKHYSQLHKYLQKYEIKYSVQPKSEDSPLEYTTLNLDDNTKKCSEVVKALFVDVMGFDERSTTVNVKYINVSPKNEKIGV